MALLERVGTLLRANLNDLIDRAEHPEKMIRQLILDMENQSMQVKTQVAIAIADHHLLEARQTETLEKEQEFRRKAELALDKGEEPLARAALERQLSFRKMAAGFGQQVSDQAVQVESLKAALHKLQTKLTEARTRAELLAAEHRRVRAVGRAADAQTGSVEGTFARMEEKVKREAAVSRAKTGLLGDDMDLRLENLDKDEQVDQLLAELKMRRLGAG